MFGKYGEMIGEVVTDSAGRIRNKKAEGDMARWLSEFIASPDSEAIRLGSALVQSTDVASRYTLYKHLKKNPKHYDPKTKTTRDMTEEEIINKVLEAFVDYKVNMPKNIKVLSDYGVLLFPSFWMRVQKVMYSIAKENPAKVATGVFISQMFEFQVPTYADSNIFVKAGNIFNEPPVFTNPVDAVFPTDLWSEFNPFT